MDLKSMFEKAINNEENSIKMYERVMEHAGNPLFRKRLEFIMEEESWQRRILSNVYKERYGSKLQIFQESTEIPNFEGKTFKEILEIAMDFELTSRLLYISMYDLTPEDDDELRKLFYYFVRIELLHYQILEVEYETIERFEELERYWPEMIG